MRHPFVLYLVLCLGQTQCQAQTPSPSDKPSLPPAGTLVLSEAWKPVVYLIQPRQFGEIATAYSGTVIDSALVSSNGSFVFSSVQIPAQPTLYQLCVQRKGNRFPNQLMDDNPLLANYMPVVLQAGQVFRCAANAETFQATFTVERPSPENMALSQLRDLRHKAYARDSFLLSTHADEATLLDHEAAVQRFRAPLTAFSDTCGVFWPALVAARWVSPAGDYERNPEFLFRLCAKWRALRPNDAWVEQLCKAGNRDRLPVLVGDIIPDFPLPMLAGDTVSLKSLFGKKLTILDIWASWCMPCRRENRDRLLPLWGQYAKQGLQIVGYSLDSGAAAWKAAVAKDGAVWPHASHLSGDATPFLETLRIRTIPANFILDAEGKVLAKNLHGAALEAFVADYFK